MRGMRSRSFGWKCSTSTRPPSAQAIPASGLGSLNVVENNRRALNGHGMIPVGWTERRVSRCEAHRDSLGRYRRANLGRYRWASTRPVAFRSTLRCRSNIGRKYRWITVSHIKSCSNRFRPASPIWRRNAWSSSSLAIFWAKSAGSPGSNKSPVTPSVTVYGSPPMRLATTGMPPGPGA